MNCKLFFTSPAAGANIGIGRFLHWHLREMMGWIKMGCKVLTPRYLRWSHNWLAHQLTGAPSWTCACQDQVPLSSTSKDSVDHTYQKTSESSPFQLCSKSMLMYTYSDYLSSYHCHSSHHITSHTYTCSSVSHVFLSSALSIGDFHSGMLSLHIFTLLLRVPRLVVSHLGNNIVLSTRDFHWDSLPRV